MAHVINSKPTQVKKKVFLKKKKTNKLIKKKEIEDSDQKINIFFPLLILWGLLNALFLSKKKKNKK